MITPPPPCLAHVSDAGAASLEYRTHICIHLPVEQLVRRVDDRAARDLIASVVDQDIEAAERRDGCIDDLVGATALGNIALDPDAALPPAATMSAATASASLRPPR